MLVAELKTKIVNFLIQRVVRRKVNMNWNQMLDIEPELAFIERSCRACREDGGKFVDFWTQNVSEITRLVGPVARCPALRSGRAWKVMHSHFLQTWIDATGETRTGPWDTPAASVEPEQQQLFAQPTAGPYQ